MMWWPFGPPVPPFLSRPEVDFFLTCEYFAGMVGWLRETDLGVDFGRSLRLERNLI
jgi:hypothetical protein